MPPLTYKPFDQQIITSPEEWSRAFNDIPQPRSATLVRRWNMRLGLLHKDILHGIEYCTRIPWRLSEDRLFVVVDNVFHEMIEFEKKFPSGS